MFRKLLFGNIRKLLLLIIFILVSLYPATAQSLIANQSQAIPTFIAPQSQTEGIKVSVIKLKVIKEGDRIVSAEDEKILKEVIIPTKEFENLEAKFNSGGEIQISIKIEQFSLSHEKDEIIRLKFENLSKNNLFAQAIVTDAKGKVINLLEEFGNKSVVLPQNEPLFSHAIRTDKEINRYIIAIQKENFEISFSEGLSVGRDAKQLAGAAMMTNLGAIYESKGEYEKSIEFYELITILSQGNREFLSKEQDFESKEKHQATVKQEAAAYNNLGLLNFKFSRYDKSLASYQKALELLELLSPDSLERMKGEASTFNNIGQLFNALARFELCMEYFQKALILKQNLNDKQGQFIVLNNLGTANNLPGKYKLAIQYYNQAVTLARQLKDKRGEAVTLNNLATAKRALGDFVGAKSLLEQSLKLSSETNNLNNRAFVLNNSGLLSIGQGKFAEAVTYYQEALKIFQTLGNRAAEAVALNNLMFAYEKLNQPRLAIFFGKQSINLTQELRSEIAKLDKETQNAFLQSRAETYRKLANLLIAEGSFLTAQEVLAMLKEDEYSTFVRRDAEEIKKLSLRAGLRDEEKNALLKYEELAGNLTKIGSDFIKLEELKNKEGADFTQLNKYNALKAKLEAANAAFRLFLEKDLAQELGKEVKRQIEIDRSLQGKLREWGNGTVALYTVTTAERYRIILTTPTSQIDGKTDIPIADLNKKIFDFREALQNPSVDPRPLGKELYDILLKPIEKELNNPEIKTLLWSLDGTLRYIPMAALSPDGKSYLAEKYQNVVITSMTRGSLREEVNPNWQLLAGGVTNPSKVTEPNGTQEISFGGLPKVKDELLAIVKNDEVTNQKGKRLIDEEFKLSALEDGMSQRITDKPKYNVIHFATHFRLGSDLGRSFLLLGNNQALTLDQVSDNASLNFGGIELVTLSACNTGFGTTIENRLQIKPEERKQLEQNNGIEVDSLATFIEQRSAKAVLASLWSVADESTSLLMSEFYRLKKENPKLTKAEAMQKAQILMIQRQIKIKRKRFRLS